MYKMAFRSVNVAAKLNQRISKGFCYLTRRSFSSLDITDCPDKETHTGQKWAADDYRLCRFINREKQVNPNWAIKLVAEAPPIPVEGRVTWCDGGSGPTGHPKIFINVDKPGNHSCMYCGLRFFKKDSHH